ncbi:hypothetical protein D9615_008692 [Tricholomella constricta]|uniref:Ubiquitin-like protease family profile domain-containing protein n=1 Tax=Tricholomella constricta TaxID=117010 RepID=A0A8H5H7Q1_9AGAR|nr:hypothetical protein D9615_008692 [Tricholomella constricta]
MGKRKQKSSRSAPPKQPRSSGDLPFQLFSTRDEEQEFKSFRLAHQDRAESASSSGLNTHTTDHEEPPPADRAESASSSGLNAHTTDHEEPPPAASDDEPVAADNLGEHGSPGMKWRVVSYPETSHSAVWTSRLEERLTRAVDRACSIAPLHNLPRKAIERLRSGTWLCDDLVDHFIQNPIIPWDGIWSWNKGQISACIDTAKRILIPTNLSSHWVLLSIDLSTRRLRILDSLKSRHRSSDKNIQEEKMRLIGGPSNYQSLEQQRQPQPRKQDSWTRHPPTPQSTPQPPALSNSTLAQQRRRERERQVRQHSHAPYPTPPSTTQHQPTIPDSPEEDDNASHHNNRSEAQRRHRQRERENGLIGHGSRSRRNVAGAVSQARDIILEDALFKAARRPYRDPPMRHDLRRMNIECRHCRALHWIDERLAQSSVTSPRFSTCCDQGQVQIPLLEDPPEPLRNLLLSDSEEASVFRKHLSRR